jgi:hypothetical protein
MSIEIQEARIEGLLNAYAVFAGLGLRNGRCSFKFERIAWKSNVIESIAQLGRECSMRDAMFMPSYGESSYQDTKERTLRNIVHKELSLPDLRVEIKKWICYGFERTVGYSEDLQRTFRASANDACDELEANLKDICNDEITVLIPSHPVCRIEVLQDEFIIVSGEQLYYLSFGWSD